jgi:hypothetical protein
MNAVDTCNLALSRIGQGASRPVRSLDAAVDDSEVARACARVFEPTMRAVVREHRWSWAQGAAALSLSAEVVPGWGYVYAYPSGCAKLHGLGPADWDPGRTPVWRWPYKILAAADGESQLIATDLPQAWAHFTRAIVNPAFADDLFRDALAWRLAKELALALNASPNFASAAASEYELALSKAMAADMGEHSPDRAPLPEDVRAILDDGPMSHPHYRYPWEC